MCASPQRASHDFQRGGGPLVSSPGPASKRQTARSRQINKQKQPKQKQKRGGGGGGGDWTIDLEQKEGRNEEKKREKSEEAGHVLYSYPEPKSKREPDQHRETKRGIQD